MRKQKNQAIDTSAIGSWDFERSFNADYDVDDGSEIPFIHNRAELKKLLLPLYIVDDYMESFEMYDELFNKIENIIRGCFVIKECREYPVKFKFYATDKTSHTCELRMFYLNLIGWRAFVHLHGINNILDTSYILTGEMIPHLNDYINEKIILPLREYNVKPTVVNYVTSDVCRGYRKISMDFALILNLNFGADTFIDMYTKDEEIAEIMETKFDDLHQPSEIEDRLHTQQDRLINKLIEDKNNPIGIILRSGTGIKHKQLSEFAIAEGLKPTLEGKTIPIPIETSTLNGGLTKPSDLFIDGLGARKAVVSNKKVMGKAGYFSKSLTLLNRSLSLSTSVADCHSTHYVEYIVKTKKHLQKLDGKFYKMDPSDSDLLVIDASKDKHLIGKRIYCRSVATCALGDECCPRCVGLTANISEDIADGFVAFQTEETTKVLNQNILSTKHLLTTNSDEVLFSDTFDDFFTMSTSEIYPNVNNNEKYGDDIGRFAIYIDPNDIEKANELDEDSLYNSILTTGRLYIRDLKKEYGDILVCTTDKDGAPEDRDIYIAKEAMDIMKKNKGVIPFNAIDDELKLFELVIDNNELTKPLYDIMNLINKDRKSDPLTIDEMCQKMLDLLVDAGIDATATSSEMIVNRLIRDPDNVYIRPDFSKKKMPPYTIITARKALEKNESPYIGLSYQDIKRQALSDDLYTTRHKSSYLDPLFKTKVDMRNLKNYAKYVNPKNRAKYDKEKKERLSHTFYNPEYRKKFHDAYNS